jgi:hypothetical protein
VSTGGTAGVRLASLTYDPVPAKLIAATLTEYVVELVNPVTLIAGIVEGA